jgi:LDH2 family malate/lactate/ureidoglycolate dehydrogenase
LVFVVGLLSAVLSDTDFPWEVDDVVAGSPRDPDRHYGSCFFAMDPAAFGPMGRMAERVDAYIDEVKRAPRREGTTEVLYPGERSQRLRRQREAADSFLLPESQCLAVERLAASLGRAVQIRVDGPGTG